MKPELIKDILTSNPDSRKVTICGWVRTSRDSKNLVFIHVNDGSCFANIQLTFDRTSPSENADVNNIEENLKKLWNYMVKYLLLFYLFWIYWF